MISSDPQTPNSPPANTTPVDEKSKEAASSSIDTQITPESSQGSEIPKNHEESVQVEEGEEGDEEGEGECGFCLFMKGGGCRDVFTNWENCIKEAEDKDENIVNKCFDVTSALRVCMQANAEYYAPILKAEKAAEEEAMKQLEEEKEKEKDSTESQPNSGENQEKVVESEDSKSDNQMLELYILPKSPPANTTPVDEKSKEPASSSIDTQIAPESSQGSEIPKNHEESVQVEEGEEGDEEGEGECGFCLFMKGGGCRNVFTDWENCIKEAEDKDENIVNKCFDVTSALRVCMQANAEYYAPILKAEKAAEEEAMKQLEEEKEKENASTESQPNSGENQEKVVESEVSKSDNQMVR